MRAKFFSFSWVLCLILVISSMNLYGDNGQSSIKSGTEKQSIAPFSPPIPFTADEEFNKKITLWIGSFHPFFLHFPIALIVMTVISEFLFFWTGNLLFSQAARFMLVGAAIASIPTILFGLAFSTSVDKPFLFTFLWWHRFLGISTMLLAIITACLREFHSQKGWNTLKAYRVCLGVLFIIVNLTGYLGGRMTFYKSWTILP